MPAKLFPKNVRSLFDKSTTEADFRSLDDDTLVRAFVEVQKNYIQLSMMKNSGQLHISVIQSIDNDEKMLNILTDEIDKRIDNNRDSIEPVLKKYLLVINGKKVILSKEE